MRRTVSGNVFSTDMDASRNGLSGPAWPESESAASGAGGAPLTPLLLRVQTVAGHISCFAKVDNLCGPREHAARRPPRRALTANDAMRYAALARLFSHLS